MTATRMATVDLSALAGKTSKVIDDAATRRRATVITRAGRPVAAVIPVNEEILDEWILLTTPSFLKEVGLFDDVARRGQTIAFSDVLKRRRTKKGRAPTRR